MKKLRVMAMADKKEFLLKELQKLGCVEISAPDSKLADPAWFSLLKRGTSNLSETRTEIMDVNTALAAIKRYAQVKDGLFIQRKPVSQQDFLNLDGSVDAKETSSQICGLLQEITRLQGDEAKLEAQKAALQPWSPLGLPLEKEGSVYTIFRLGVCPSGTDTSAMRADLAEEAAEVYEVFSDKQQKYYFLILYRDHEEQIQELLRPYNFSVVTFQNLTGTAAENLQKLDEALSENRKQQECAVEAIVQKADSRDALRLYADQLAAEASKHMNAERILTDDTVIFFEGWVPAERLQEVEGLLERTGCAWEHQDPTAEEIPDVPVKLKNNWLTKPLSMVTEMYSLPAYDNVDPNPLMAPFFILFYGIMMADMGYGLLMFLAGLLIGKKYRPKGTAGNLFGLMTLCGVSTFIMGVVTGGFFGDFLTQAVLLATGKDFALPALFTPLDDTLMILIGSMALGFVHIVTGMAISVIRKCKRGEFMDALWNEITWWIVFAGIALMVLNGSLVVLIAGIVLVVLGPLVNGKGIGKITGIFASLYNNITGYFGDILSYSRLMALMLAGSVIAQVFNTLGAIPGNIILFVIISLVGNTLNFGLNLLGCYVHDLRLQCLEYFGKFYEDGGKPFSPLAMDTKYVDIQQN